MTKKKKRRLLGAAAVLLALACVGIFLGKRSQTPMEPSLPEVLERMGFTVLVPPCTLTPPGAMIVIRSRDPLIPGLVCPIETSLGSEAQGRLRKSDTISVSAAARLSESFSLAGYLKDILATSSKYANVRDVRLSLTNVRVLELPDDAVFELLSKRSGPCTNAIAARRAAGTEVSIVKAALYADANVTIQYSTEMTAAAKAELTRELAASLGADLEIEGESTIAGRGLIWGIRDDIDLARVGSGLPASGGASRPRLLPAGLRVNTEVFLESLPSLVEEHVDPVKQPSRNSCWAAVWTMMKSWREGRTLSIEDAVTSLGEPWVGYFRRDTGLPGGTEMLFAHESGLRTMWPANHTVKGWVEFLQTYGPLWVFLADGISSHALLIVGVRGEESHEGAYLSVIDPLTGRRSERHAADFARKFELEAYRAVTLSDKGELRLQVMHWPAK